MAIPPFSAPADEVQNGAKKSIYGLLWGVALFSNMLALIYNILPCGNFTSLCKKFLGMMGSMRAYPTLMTIIGALSTVTTAVYTAFLVYSLWTGSLQALLVSFMLISEISKKHQKSAASEWRDKYSKQPDKSTSESFLLSEQAFSRPADQVNTMWHHLLLCICYTTNVLAPHP